MQEPPPPPDASFAPLVLDAALEQPLRRFRSTSDLPPLPPDIDPAGLSDLRCSGSAQFSASGWDQIRAQLGNPSSLHVIDLRQESHGFVNGDAVSWYATQNWGAVGLGVEQSLALEALRLELLSRSEEIGVGDVRTVKQGRRPAFVSKQRLSVMSERELVAPLGTYVRFPVTDHLRPRDEVVDAFVAFVRSLAGRPHLHFHCRGGKGRTAMFMALYDMMRNAHRVALHAILARQRIVNDYDLTSLPEEGAPKRPFIAERRLFLEQFYRFALDGSGTWTGWLAEHPA